MFSWKMTMARILFFFLALLQATVCFASGSLALPDSLLTESSPKSKEIRKIVKLLENPRERENLLKTLKVLAAAQEAEEKKKGESLASYMTPLIQWIMDGVSVFLINFKKIPVVATEFIDYLKIEDHRNDFWTALLIWFPILILIEMLFERLHLWLLRRAFEGENLTEKVRDLAHSKSNYACAKLFLPFLYPMLFLPLYISHHPVRNWVTGFWIALFVSRMFLLGRKKLPALAIPSKKTPLPGQDFLMWFTVLALSLLLMAGGMINIWHIINGQDFFLTPLLLLAFPLFILYFREWRVKEMPGYLEASRSLATVPQKLAPLINLCIRYLPAFILVIVIPLCMNQIFFSGNLWKTYGVESLETLIVLIIFLKGRRYIDAGARLHLPKFQTVKLQAFISYISPLLNPFARCLQWILYLSFFTALIMIWNNCSSDSLINIISHPLTKTGITIGLMWGIIYLLWLGLDFLAQFHTKPQMIKGKRREPTVFAKTFGPMLHSIARWLMVLVTIFITLESCGFDLKILVYLMSAFAFAISLGSQSLVKDIINGFFALVDGSFAVGDIVTVGPHTGAVESLSLRAITLRHSNGSLQTIPFSEVGNIINQSRDYTVVPIDIATSYKTQIGSVYEALTRAAEEIAQDPVFGKMILTPLSISGIDRFAESAVHVSASIKITPDPNHYFAREFNRRLKVHMDAMQITPPISFQEQWSNR